VVFAQKKRYDQKQQHPRSREAGGEAFFFSSAGHQAAKITAKEEERECDIRTSAFAFGGRLDFAGWVAVWICFNCWMLTWV
jgi:hypothetical protein